MRRMWAPAHRRGMTTRLVDADLFAHRTRTTATGWHFETPTVAPATNETSADGVSALDVVAAA